MQINSISKAAFKDHSSGHRDGSVVESLPGMGETLGSIPNIGDGREEERNRRVIPAAEPDPLGRPRCPAFITSVNEETVHIYSKEY
jgi:hypothetical protein